MILDVVRLMMHIEIHLMRDTLVDEISFDHFDFTFFIK